MRIRKFFVLMLVALLLVGVIVVPVAAKKIEVDHVEYENEVMLSAYWAPHVSLRKTTKISLSADVPYKSSTKSLCVEYDITKLGWGIYYFTFLEPDAVEYGEYITFMAKADSEIPLTIGIVQKDIGFGGNNGGRATVTTEWQRFSFPLSELYSSADKTMNVLDSIEKDNVWISNVSFGLDCVNDNSLATGTFWVDDIAFVSEADIAGLPKAEMKATTTTKKPTTTTKKPTTTTKKPTTTTKNDTTTTTQTVSASTTLGGESTAETDTITTTTTGGNVELPGEDAETTGALTVLDSLIGLNGDKLSVPSGMTVSNVLSRLRAEAGCEMAIVKDDAAVASTEKVTSGMKLIVSKNGSELKSYTMDITVSVGSEDSKNNGWVLPMCVAAGVVVIAAVLLVVFRKNIFKK